MRRDINSWKILGRALLSGPLFLMALDVLGATALGNKVMASVNMPDANPAFLDDERLRVFASTDVPQETVDAMIRDTKDAYSVWMRRDYYGKNQAKAIYLNIPGSDLAASELAYTRYCEHIEAVGLPYQPLCLPDAKYLRYVDDGGGSINSDPRYGFWAFFMGAKFGNQRTTAFHEVFHIYQMTNIFTDEPCCSNFPDVDSKMGQRTGDDPNENVIWWSEGNATFFGYLHGSANLAEFKSNMRDRLESDSTFGMSNKAEYLTRGTKLYNIPYGRDDTGLGYGIGAWFSAYVTFNHGEEKIYQVWETTDQKGFVTAFSEVFGKSYREVIEDFDLWLAQDNQDLLQILDSIYEASPAVIADLNAATASEIQVTEAYIGLLGRAPDPNGLAYWVSQLTLAVAAGEEAAVALKKLTNDITLSAEWDGGLGALVATDGSMTQTNAESLVNSMYLNLFERAATAADKAYWSAELVSGATTASEMAIQLIQGAKANRDTTDASVLGYKQEAATYYVHNVWQDEFTATSAKNAVKDVRDPATLAASKGVTDSLRAGVGINTGLASKPAVAVTRSVKKSAASVAVTAIPSLPFYGLWTLSGLLALIGLRRLNY